MPFGGERCYPPIGGPRRPLVRFFRARRLRLFLIQKILGEVVKKILHADGDEGAGQIGIPALPLG